MNNIAIIPARWGSKRIPKKNIIEFAGKPLIAHTIEQALNSKLVGEVYVSTDAPGIANVAKEYGAKVVDRHPDHCLDISSSEEALEAFLATTGKYLDIDSIVFLQCTSPLRRPDDIDRAITKFWEERADSLFSACLFNKYIWKNDRGPESINFKYNEERWREQDFPHQFMENGSIFVIKPWVLEKFNSRYGGKMVMYEMDVWDSFQIDEPGDLGICEKILEMREDGIIHDRR